MILKTFRFDNATTNARRVLVLRQAQGEDEFDDGSVEILILSLSKDEDSPTTVAGQHTPVFPTGQPWHEAGDDGIQALKRSKARAG